MFRTEQLSENVVVHCGDCREIIPMLNKQGAPSGVAVISDPPYGIESLVGGYGRSVAKDKRHDQQSDRHIANDKSLDCVVEALDLIRKQFDNIWLALFYSSRISPVFFQATSMLDYYGEIIWDKKVIGLGEHIRYRHENIGMFKLGEPEELGNCESLITYLALKGDNRSVHPHEKPHQLMHNICRVVPGKVILDPFAGTGSTGAAAVQLKRGFIGIEYNEKYYDIMRKKVSDAMKQDVNWWEE